MYKKAREGLLQNFIGIDNRYEIPKKPNLIVNIEDSTIEQMCTNDIKLSKRNQNHKRNL